MGAVKSLLLGILSSFLLSTLIINVSITHQFYKQCHSFSVDCILTKHGRSAVIEEEPTIEEDMSRELTILEIQQIENDCERDESCQSVIESSVNQLLQEESITSNHDTNGMSHLLNIQKEYEVAKANMSNTYNTFLSLQQQEPQQPEKPLTMTLTSFSELLSMQSYQDYDVAQLQSLIQKSKTELKELLDASNFGVFEYLINTLGYGGNAFTCDNANLKHSDTFRQSYTDKYIPYYTHDGSSTHELYNHIHSIKNDLKLRMEEYHEFSENLLLSDDSIEILKLEISSLITNGDHAAASSCLDTSFITLLYEIGQEAHIKKMNVSNVLSNAIKHLQQHDTMDTFTFPQETTAVKKKDMAIELYSLLSALIDTPLTKQIIDKLDGVADALGGYNSLLDGIIDALSESNDGNSISKNALNRVLMVLDWLEEKKKMGGKNVMLNGKSGILTYELMDLGSSLLDRMSF